MRSASTRLAASLPAGRRPARSAARRPRGGGQPFGRPAAAADRWFTADAAACGWDLFLLKARYSTASHELIARRMLECRPPIIVSIFDNGRLSLRRSNVPGRVPPPADAETECWRRVRQCETPCQDAQGPIAIQGWPIYEEGWKREILRTQLQQWEACC